MEKEKQAVTDEEMVIEEFKTSASVKRESPKGRKYRNKRKKRRVCLIMGMFALSFLLAALIGMFLLKLSAVTVCFILVLEVFIAVCLHDTPIGLHLLEILIGIAAGIIFGKAAFMGIAAVIYLAAVFVLYLLGRKDFL